MTKTYTDYIAELDDLLVDTRGQVMTTEVALSITVLTGRAVIAARAELLDHIGQPANGEDIDRTADISCPRTAEMVAEQNYERYMTVREKQ
jgi:hypothetical protein